MGLGFLCLSVTAGGSFKKPYASAGGAARPVVGARVKIFSCGALAGETLTDVNGRTEKFPLDFKDVPAVPYAAFDAEISAHRHAAVRLNGIKIFNGETALLPVRLLPDSGGKFLYTVPAHRLTAQKTEHSCEHPCERARECPADYAGFTREISIPEKITVHLGKPNENAANVSVNFRDYIKNVCAHEAYPTWPHAALEAIIYCQTSFALNRLFTGWYKRKRFDITNDASFDQQYVHGSHTFEKIDALADKIFNRFVRFENHREPFFDKTGHWYAGAARMAEQGYNALEILRHFISKDIQIMETLNIESAGKEYPGHPLREGMSGEHVSHLQRCLKEICANYPGVPAARDDGYFGPETAAAVNAFLQTDTGIVDKTGWYKISFPKKRRAPDLAGTRRNVSLLEIAAIAQIYRQFNRFRI